MPTQEASQTSNRRLILEIITLSISLIALVVAGVSAYFAFQSNRLSQEALLNNSWNILQAKTHSNIGKVSAFEFIIRNASFQLLDIDLTCGGECSPYLNNLNFSSEMFGKEVNLSNINLTGAQLKNAKFTNIMLEDSSFSRSDLSSAVFEETTLNRSKFVGATLRSAKFNNMNLKNINFQGSQIHFTDFTKTDMQKVDFTNADMWKVAFIDLTILDSDFKDAYAGNINFSGNRLDDVDFSGTNLTLTNFTNAYLTNVNFGGTNVSETNFTNSEISNITKAGSWAWKDRPPTGILKGRQNVFLPDYWCTKSPEAEDSYKKVTSGLDRHESFLSQHCVDTL